uniref:Tyrosine specific protein phosphatases domain-containing protein n=1 Tax=Neobodo designis TaxID=312471 RepID=A0A7S1M1T9_NEODS
MSAPRAAPLVHPDPLERLALLRHSARTITLSVAKFTFNRARGAPGSATEVAECLESVKAAIPDASLPEPTSDDWFTAAFEAVLRRADAHLTADLPGGLVRHGTGTATLEDALWRLLGAGGHRPLDIIRRSMQQIHPALHLRDGATDAPARLDGATAPPPVRIFISGKIAAGGAALLDYFRVSHVITCFATGRTIDVGDRHRLVLPCVDDEAYDLSRDFETAIAFFDAACAEAAAAGSRLTLLVHCAAGMHRCTAISAAILVKSLGYDLPTALAAIKSVRPMAEPTPSFLRQLEKLAGGEPRAEV